MIIKLLKQNDEYYIQWSIHTTERLNVETGDDGKEYIVFPDEPYCEFFANEVEELTGNWVAVHCFGDGWDYNSVSLASVVAAIGDPINS